MMPSYQQRWVSILPEPEHKPARRRLTPDDVSARSAAEAKREIRDKVRRVYVADRHFEVISTSGEYRHHIVIVKVGDGYDLRCESPQCRAPKGACWACLKVARSDAMREAMDRIVSNERGAAPQTRPAPLAATAAGEI